MSDHGSAVLLITQINGVGGLATVTAMLQEFGQMEAAEVTVSEDVMPARKNLSCLLVRYIDEDGAYSAYLSMSTKSVDGVRLNVKFVVCAREVVVGTISRRSVILTCMWPSHYAFIPPASFVSVPREVMYIYVPVSRGAAVLCFQP